MIKLPKNFVGGRLLVSDDDKATWLTNGHWAIQRLMVADAALLGNAELVQAMFPRASVDSIELDSVEKIVPDDPSLQYLRTPWVKSLGVLDVYLFVANQDDPETRHYAWLNRTYVERFDLDFVFAAEPTAKQREKYYFAPMVNSSNPLDVSIIVMPCRGDAPPTWLGELGAEK